MRSRQVSVVQRKSTTQRGQSCADEPDRSWKRYLIYDEISCDGWREHVFLTFGNPVSPDSMGNEDRQLPDG